MQHIWRKLVMAYWKRGPCVELIRVNTYAWIRSDLREWRRRRAQARNDLPSLKRLAGILEAALSSSHYESEESKEIAIQLEALQRHIVRSSLRFR